VRVVCSALYLRLLCTITVLAWTVAGTVWYTSADRPCLDDAAVAAGINADAHVLEWMRTLLLLLVCVNWAAMALFFFFVWCAYSALTRHNQLEVCEGRMRCIACYCCWSKSESERAGADKAVFEAVSEVLTHVLDANCDGSERHTVASDIFVGFALVQSTILLSAATHPSDSHRFRLTGALSTAKNV
jgi:hypothetical protein